MEALALVNLSALMDLTTGSPEITIALIDGPVALAHPALAHASIREHPSGTGASCAQASSIACMHGTFIAGMLAARRDSAAPAICPDCSFVLRPIFSESTAHDMQMPSASPEGLATAIFECLQAGARVINLSLAITQPSAKTEQELEQALDLAANRGVLVVAAAGNQGTIGSTSITRHPWVIPVVACDLQGVPMAQSNLSRAIAQGGLRAPGEQITSLGSDGTSQTAGGTSVAAPFVTGAIGLLWSLFPHLSGGDIKYAINQLYARQRKAMLPPLLDAWAAYEFLQPSNIQGGATLQ